MLYYLYSAVFERGNRVKEIEMRMTVRYKRYIWSRIDSKVSEMKGKGWKLVRDNVVRTDRNWNPIGG